MKVNNKNGIAVIIVMVVFALCGVITIYSIAENISNDAIAFYALDENDLISIKYNEKEQNEAKKSVESILDSGVKVKISRFCGNNNVIVCYAKNVYIELDRDSMHPVFVFYECQKYKEKYTEDKCRKIAEHFVLKNVPRGVSTGGAELTVIDDSGCVLTYEMKLEQKTVVIAVRKDTGHIVFYDARALFSL